MYWHHGFGILGGLIWLGIVAYVLWLALRLVRALERIADKSERKPSERIWPDWQELCMRALGG